MIPGGYFLTGTRGGGKGAYSVHLIKECLESGKRVATNMDIIIENLLDSDSSSSITRLPDKPTGKSLFDLGQGYDFNPKDPSTFDPRKNGLIVLDEISLFLTSKRDPDFEAVSKFLVLSRKTGWDLVLVGQTKDQPNEVLYKALCDKLIVCQADNLVKIPYLSSILKFFGASGYMPDGHTAVVFSGRSELSSIDEQIPFKSMPVRLAYNTYQLFGDGVELVGDKFIDMRANYSLVPSNIITKSKFLNFYKEKIKTLTNIKEGESMAIGKSSGFDMGAKIKMGLLLLAFVAFMYFKNPMDNQFINPDVKGTIEAIIPPEASISEPSLIIQSSSKDFDFIRDLFDNFKPRLTGYASSQHYGVTVMIDFYHDNQIIERVNLDDLHRFGYSVIPSGNAVNVKGEGFLKRVTSWTIHNEPVKPPETINLPNSII